MKKLIFILTLVAISFSFDKWEYAIAEYRFNYGKIKLYPPNRRAQWIVTYNDTRQDTTIQDTIYWGSGDVKSKLYGINKMGQDGWEMIFYDWMGEKPSREYYFKRKID